MSEVNLPQLNATHAQNKQPLLTPSQSGDKLEQETKDIKDAVERTAGRSKLTHDLSATDVVDQVSELNGMLENAQSYLRFETDNASERMLIRIRDQQTDEVIRQIPSEQFLSVSENLSQFLERRNQDPVRFSEPILPGLLANVTV